MPSGDLLLTGTGRLAVAQPAGWARPGVLTDWGMLVRDDRVAWVGPRAEAPHGDHDSVALGAALVTPGLIDAHTHPVFAGDRADEASARLEGVAYTGGGILRTVTATRATADDELERLVAARMAACLAAGTTTLEAKSGYGLSLEEELRHLRILERAGRRTGLRVIRTFLGAHAVPREAASSAVHAALVADEMVPRVASEGAAEFVDVFADRDFFDLDDLERIARAARTAGLGLRLHAEQLARTGAAERGVRLGAVSVDHLEQLDGAGVAAIAASSTVATLLPGPALVLRAALPPARALIDAGATVALATDSNAGTFGAWGAMPLAIGLGATLLGMTVAEALAAATDGGARSLGLTHHGVLRAGAVADIVAWDAEHEGAFALNLGDVRPARTWIAGREVGSGR